MVAKRIVDSGDRLLVKKVTYLSVLERDIIEKKIYFMVFVCYFY